MAQSGFIGIVGPTNSGKSTLLNALVGEKVSIVSPKVQTTHHPIRGIINQEDVQFIFVDTPGFHHHKDPLARALREQAKQSAQECDAILWVFDVSNPRLMTQFEELKPLIEKKFKSQQNFLLLNKVDLVSKPTLLPLIESFHKTGIFSDILPISALKKDGIPKILKLAQEHLKDTVFYYERTSKTDRTPAYRISEIVREKAFELTHKEIPYSIHTEAQLLKETPKKVWACTLFVDSDSKKKILIGNKGSKIKDIGMAARKEIEKVFHKDDGGSIYLELRVQVDKDWKFNSNRLKKYLEVQS